MTTPYPTESTPARGTADAGRDTSSTTAPDGTEPVPVSSAPGAAEAHVDHGAPAAAGTRAPEIAEIAEIAETTELDGVAITERLGAEGTSRTEGGESSAEGQSPAAPSSVYLPGPGPSVASPAPAATATAAAAAAAAAEESSAPERRGARMGTVVWGILLAAIGAGIVARGLDVGFDVELALIVVLCVMGGALLVGSIVAVIRKT